MTTDQTLAPVTDETLAAVVGADCGVLIMTRSDCGHCARYRSEIEGLRARGELAGVAVGTLVLDRPGTARFKRDHPWLAGLAALPYTVLYRAGRPIDGFAASRAAYLRERLEATLAPPD